MKQVSAALPSYPADGSKRLDSTRDSRLSSDEKEAINGRVRRRGRGGSTGRGSTREAWGNSVGCNMRRTSLYQQPFACGNMVIV